MKNFKLKESKKVNKKQSFNKETKHNGANNNSKTEEKKMSIIGNEVKITTNKVVIHNPHINEMWSYNDSMPKKYSVAAIIPTTDTETIALINEAIEQATDIGRRLYGEHIDFASPLKYPGSSNSLNMYYKFNYAIFASTNIKPTVFNEEKQKICISESKIEGHYARISMSFYPYSRNGKSGIGCALHNVQLFQDMFDISQYMPNPEDDF